MVFLEIQVKGLDMDIVALSENLWLGFGTIQEIEYPIFWCGKEDVQQHGVGFAIKTHLLKHAEPLVGLLPRLMKLKLSAYSLTIEVDEDEKDSLYGLLEEEVTKGRIFLPLNLVELPISRRRRCRQDKQ